MNIYRPILYILMRTDMNSMNAGKAMAQAGHAVSAMMHEQKDNEKFQENFQIWQKETEQGFGTSIVLAVSSEQELYDYVDKCKTYLNVFASVVNDPTYPIRDGEITHLVNVNTCAYIFSNSENFNMRHLSKLNLHP